MRTLPVCLLLASLAVPVATSQTLFHEGAGTFVSFSPVSARLAPTADVAYQASAGVAHRLNARVDVGATGLVLRCVQRLGARGLYAPPHG